MRPPDKERTFLTLAVIALAAVLVFLGVLQYRWSGEISQAASERLQANLQKSMSTFRDRLTHEILDVCVSLQPDRDFLAEGGAARYSVRLLQWQRSATNGRLLKKLYIARRPSADTPMHLFELNPTAEKFAPSEWPSKFADLRHLMDALPDAPPFMSGGPGRAEMAHSFHGAQGHGWVLDQSIPALVYPIFDASTRPNERPTPPSWLILQLDPAFLKQQILPELAHSQFALSHQLDFKVAVLGGSEEQSVVIYSSEPGFGNDPRKHYAGRMKLWAPPSPPDHPGVQGPARDMSAGQRYPGEPPIPARLLVLHDSRADRDWELVVDPRNGSLEMSVLRLRHRNLMVSFGILLILAGTIAAIIITTAKARRLAALQMEFVTGVTHELRTPLAVILSASENIKDGLVSKPAQLARYGDMIHRQTKQLMQLVEQVLLFASSRRSHLKIDLEPTDVIPAIEAALQTATDSGVIVERHFDADLPLVMADPAALTQCLQNLVANAVKYGSIAPWIGIDVHGPIDHGAAEVAVTVQDRGIGIHRSEIPHIFEPFYRSPSVSASNVHGTGLGLSLTRNMIEAMGGRITVESQPDRGSSFTVYLRAAASLQTAISEPGEESEAPIPHV